MHCTSLHSVSIRTANGADHVCITGLVNILPSCSTPHGGWPPPSCLLPTATKILPGRPLCFRVNGFINVVVVVGTFERRKQRAMSAKCCGYYGY